MGSLNGVLRRDFSRNHIGPNLTADIFNGFYNMSLLDFSRNHIGPNLTADIFNGFYNMSLLDLSFNKLRSIPDGAFTGCKQLQKLTLFSNHIKLLKTDTLEGVSTNVRLLISSKSLRKILPEIQNPLIECAPSAINYTLCGGKVDKAVRYGLLGSACDVTMPNPFLWCYNCSFSPAGTYGTPLLCLKCPAGGFYQDEMGQIECKNCSTGTYVPERHYLGKSATDCYSCPYVYSRPNVKDSGGGNNSTFINVMFLIFNSVVLIMVIGKGVHYLKDAYRCKRHQRLEMMEPLTYEH
ncbi:Vasorin [Stylophora pistillata]|uniref:Vasorin n=1 Tax=Stylophora pistillata TaxID=50429 RepID=A0A2B4S2M7_STYPI|nr:Vasorin [Stylophora pistillata]